MYSALYAGGIEDWMEGHLGVDNAYTIMLYRPTDHFNTKMSMEVRLCFDINYELSPRYE